MADHVDDDITRTHHDHGHDSDPDSAPTHNHYSPEAFDFGELFGHDVYRAPPVSYSTGFFDHILNPAGLDHGRYSPFAWRPYSPFTGDMPPTTRARPQERSDRLANGYVDLTSAPDSPPRRRKAQSPTPGPSAKRQKRRGSAEVKQQSAEPEKVEELDLTQQTPLQEALQKQREDAVKAQAKPEETVTTFNSFNCVICMDNPTDLTATACGGYNNYLNYFR
jgi:hypothetical protein